jgi:MFS family permease
MGRRTLAVIVALIVAVAIFLVAQMVGTLFPAASPKNYDYMSMQERSTYFGSMPIGAYLTNIFGYLLGSIAAGWIVAKVSQDRHTLTLPLIVGVILTIGGILNFFVAAPGQPVWVVVVSLVIFIPFTLIGQKFSRRR